MKMRRRSERKKSSDTVQSPIVVKRSERRSRRSPSHSESKKSAKTEDSKSHAANSGGDSKYRSTPRKSRDSTQDETKDSSDTPELTPIKEAASEASSEDPNESGEEGKVVSDEKPERVHDRKKADEDASANTKQNHLEENLQDEMNGISNDGNTTPKTNIESHSREESPDTNCEDSSQVKDEINDQENNNSSDKSEEETESKRTSIRNTERRTQSAERTIETESTNAKCTREFSTSGNENALGHKRKRRWLSKKSSQENSHILAISTDSLKNLISDVHPVPLCDVNLESSPEVEEVVDSEREAGELSPPPVMPRTEKTAYEKEPKLARKNERKGSVGTDDYEYTKSSSSKKPPSCILYITNLVRPFTLLQLKCLLARTGKIVEDGFWIDKIKSKCYVQYETEDEAVETRHALHGVRWPISNPKCLHVDFGTAAEMEKAVASSQDGAGAFGPESGRENRIIGTGWDKDRNEYDEKKTQVGRPVREWDVGKKEEMDSEVERKERGRTRLGEKNDRAAYGERSGKENLRSKDPNDRSESTRKRRSMESNQRRSLSESPSRKNKKKNNDPPLRLLDDLFRKTKTTPCIYWLPLTPEQIAEKEAFRLRRIAEHQERIKQREQEKEKEREREKEREKERERERERRRERERSVGHRRSASRDKRRY